MEAKDREMEAATQQMEANALQLQTQREEIEKRLTSLETSKKRSRKAKHNDSCKISKNISFANGVFSWRKSIKRTKGSKGGYKTIVEAQQGCAHLYVGLAERSTPFRFVGTLRVFLPHFEGRWPFLIRQNRSTESSNHSNLARFEVPVRHHTLNSLCF